jgi:restriction system protein
MVPDFQTLMLPVLRHAAERRWRTRELVERLSDEFGLTEEERARTIPSGRQGLMANRVHWAVTYLVQAGLLLRPARGECEATAAGRALLDEAPERLSVAALTARYPALRDFLGRRPDSEDRAAPRDTTPSPAASDASSSPAALPGAAAATPDDAIDSALAAIEAKVRQDLLDRLLEAPPDFFERVVVDLLLAMGYGSTAEDAGRTLGRTGDGGVDGVIREDRLGLDLIYVQAKRYRDGPVTADQLRSFAGALDDKGARKGVFITTSRFTADARSFAERQQMKRIALVDGDTLTSLMLRHDVGVRPARTIVLKKLDLDYFEPDDPA